MHTANVRVVPVRDKHIRVVSVRTAYRSVAVEKPNYARNARLEI